MPPIKCETTNEIKYNDDVQEYKSLTKEEELKLSQLLKKERQVKNDNVNIKNPFMIKSEFEVRLSLDKDPRKHKGNTEYTDLYQTGETDFKLVNHFDSGFNYDISKNNNVSQDIYKEISTIDNFDYVLDGETLNKLRKDGKQIHKEDSKIPLSFIQINNERDGAIWYKKHYPKIPDDLIPIICRYHWGEPITKKSIKNEKKKIEKKAKQQGLKIENKKVFVSFD